MMKKIIATNPVDVMEDTPFDPATTLTDLLKMRRELKQTVVDPLASYPALPGVLKTTERYYRDVKPAPSMWRLSGSRPA